MTVSTRLLATALAIGSLFMSSATSWAQSDKDDRVLFILDGSGSMWGQVDGTAKISVAKDVMTDLILGWDEDVPVGLMVYGHRKKGDCGDIELVARPGELDRFEMIDRVQAISPKGKTPITASLIEASSAIEASRGNADIILISDGLETCDADPCVMASTYELLNPEFEVHVVGFDVTDEEAAALQCMSDKTGGQFLRANDAESLKTALSQTVALNNAPTETPFASQKLFATLCEDCEAIAPLNVQWTVTNQDGNVLYSGLGEISGDQVPLQPGTYQVKARYLSSALVREGDIRIGENGQQVGRFNLNGGAIRSYAYATNDRTQPADPIFYQYFPIENGKAAGNALGRAAASGQSVWLPAGDYRAKATHQNVDDTQTLTVTAGQITDYDFDLRVGYVAPSAVLTPGGKPLGGSVDYEVFLTEADAKNGQNRLVFALGAQNKTVPIRAGTYWMRVILTYNRGVQSLRRVFPFEITPNETTQPVFDMNAGLLKHVVRSASGASISNIDYVSESDGRRVAYYNLGSSKTVALGVGDYRLRVLSGGKTHMSEPFSIIAGEMTEFEMSVP